MEGVDYNELIAKLCSGYTPLTDDSQSIEVIKNIAFNIMFANIDDFYENKSIYVELDHKYKFKNTSVILYEGEDIYYNNYDTMQAFYCNFNIFDNQHFREIIKTFHNAKSEYYNNKNNKIDNITIDYNKYSNYVVINYTEKN